jgi:hypothetical protein
MQNNIIVITTKNDRLKKQTGLKTRRLLIELAIGV